MLNIDPETAKRLERLAREKGIDPNEMLRRLMDPNGGHGEVNEWFAAPADVETMAKEQGVVPIARFEELLGTFWPEDDTEEFLETIRSWRSGG